MGLLSVWLKEAGVSWTDTQAVKDVLKRKLASNEFSALRVWEGSY
jgi:nucleoside permease NupC